MMLTCILLKTFLPLPLGFEELEWVSTRNAIHSSQAVPVSTKVCKEIWGLVFSWMKTTPLGLTNSRRFYQLLPFICPSGNSTFLNSMSDLAELGCNILPIPLGTHHHLSFSGRRILPLRERSNDLFHFPQELFHCTLL